MFDVHRLSERERILRISPLDRIFPKLTKCEWFEHSGIGQTDVSVNLEDNTFLHFPKNIQTFQNQDFLCLLSYNYIYEKLCLVSKLLLHFLYRGTEIHEHCTVNPFRSFGCFMWSPCLLLLPRFCSGAPQVLTHFQVCRLPASCSPLLAHSESRCGQKEEYLLCYSTRKSERLYVSITSPCCAVFSMVLAAPDSEECQRRRV